MTTETDKAVLCSECRAECVPNGRTTGYGEDPDTGAKRCYDCCARWEAARMTETGRAGLYLTWEVPRAAFVVTDWPGRLRFQVYHWRKGKHNIGRKRVDVWFRGPDGKRWHGVNIGDNQIVRCKRVKG